jgi:hypothetical protein
VTFQLLRNFFDNHGIFSKIRKFSVIVFDRRCVPYAIVESFEMKFLFTIVLKKSKIFTYVIYIIYCYLLNLFFQNGPYVFLLSVYTDICSFNFVLILIKT